MSGACSLMCSVGEMAAVVVGWVQSPDLKDYGETGHHENIIKYYVDSIHNVCTNMFEHNLCLGADEGMKDTTFPYMPILVYYMGGGSEILCTYTSLRFKWQQASIKESPRARRFFDLTTLRRGVRENFKKN
ncbi:hypothetical protein ACJJTC_002089 [Scirpophaga incertulas]